MGSPGEGNAQLQSLICISKLGGPVNVSIDGKSVDVLERMNMFQDQFGAVHWGWGMEPEEPENIIQLPEHLRASLMAAAERGVPMPNGLPPGDMDLSDHPAPPEEPEEDLRS
jgi:hypothetical protein